MRQSARRIADAATIERLTRERDEAVTREYHATTSANMLKQDLDDATAALAKMQQERDEANERTAAAVDDYNDALAQLAKAREGLTAFAEYLDNHRPSAAQLQISLGYNDAAARALEWAAQQARTFAHAALVPMK